MKRQLVVLGPWCLFVGFVACGSESRSLHHGGDDEVAGDGPGGEGPGGQSTGGTPGTGGADGIGGGLAGHPGSGGMVGGAGTGGSVGTGGSSAGAGAGGMATVPCGAIDCLSLPNVRPGAHVECQDGRCIIPPDACEEGYGHCSAFWNEGCEADLHRSNTCGDCDTHCFGSTPACTRGADGWQCSDGCSGETPDLCSGRCTDFETDVNNCGSCWNDCANHVLAECVDGECRPLGPCESQYGDCTDEPGCETELRTPEHCGACGRDDCGAANAVVECSSASGCVPPTCAAGFANCDRTSVDCESNGTACFPDALAPIELPWPPTRIAIIDGGALFAIGSFAGSAVDFDPSNAVDTHSAIGQGDAYITRYDVSGAYAWTRTFGGSLDDYARTAALARDGTLLVGGTFAGTADFDPGSGVDQHVAGTTGSGFVSKLTAAGALVWARDFPGEVIVEQLAGDAAGAVYAIGIFTGTVDLDPGPATSAHTADGDSPFLVKLDASGNFAWDRIISGHGDHVISGLAVAADASVWIAGWQDGHVSFGDRSLGDEPSMFAAGLEPSGPLRTLWLPGASALANRASVGAGANVYVAATLMESLDLDPDAGTDVRLSFFPGGASGFAVALGLAGTYRNAHVFPSEPEAVHETPGAGFLVQLPDHFPTDASPNLVAYYSDGTPAWTLRTGPGSYGELAVSATHFAVWGAEEREMQGSFGEDERSFTSADKAIVRRYAF